MIWCQFLKCNSGQKRNHTSLGIFYGDHMKKYEKWTNAQLWKLVHSYSDIRQMASNNRYSPEKGGLQQRFVWLVKSILQPTYIKNHMPW